MCFQFVESYKQNRSLFFEKKNVYKKRITIFLIPKIQVPVNCPYQDIRCWSLVTLNPDVCILGAFLEAQHHHKVTENNSGRKRSPAGKIHFAFYVV